MQRRTVTRVVRRWSLIIVTVMLAACGASTGSSVAINGTTPPSPSLGTPSGVPSQSAPSSTYESSSLSTSTPAAGAAAGGLPNPCSLLTAADVQGVRGAAANHVGTPNPGETDVSECTYDLNAAHKGQVQLSLALSARHLDSCRMRAETNRPPDLTVIAGLGDGAAFDAVGDNIAVKKGPVCFEIGIADSDSPPYAPEQAVALARIVLGRLPG